MFKLKKVKHCVSITYFQRLELLGPILNFELLGSITISLYSFKLIYLKIRNFRGQTFSQSTGPKIASFAELIFAIRQFISSFAELIFVGDA